MVTFMTINIYSPPELNCILNKFSFPSIFEKRDTFYIENYSRGVSSPVVSVLDSGSDGPGSSPGWGMTLCP